MLSFGSLNQISFNLIIALFYNLVIVCLRLAFFLLENQHKLSQRGILCVQDYTAVISLWSTANE